MLQKIEDWFSGLPNKPTRALVLASGTITAFGLLGLIIFLVAKLLFAIFGPFSFIALPILLVFLMLFGAAMDFLDD